jgi:hypothetical protein
LSIQLLNTVVDSLDLRISRIASSSEWLKLQLQSWRDYQDKSDFESDPLMVLLSGLGYWRLKWSGRKPYEFVLINPNICDIYIWNPDKWDKAISTQTGQIYVSFRSEFLQHLGLDAVVSFIGELHRIFFASWSNGFVRVSRGDLAADVQLEQNFGWSDVTKFVSRSRYREIAANSDESIVDRAKDVVDRILAASPPQGITRGVLPTAEPQTCSMTVDQLELIKAALDSFGIGEDGYLYRSCHTREPQTFYFGRFGSPLYARIYDKLSSLDKQAKGYMRDIWLAAGWDGVSPVWRFEFSLSGDFLKEAVDLMHHDDSGCCPHDLREFADFKQAIPSLWAYLTERWLRHTSPSDTDLNLWRSLPSEIWSVVQSAFGGADAVPAVRMEHPKKYDDRQMFAQLRGIALSVAAERSPTDALNESAYSCVFELWNYFESSTFEDEFLERRRLRGKDDLSRSTAEGLSDTDFSAQLRSERMLEDGSS